MMEENDLSSEIGTRKGVVGEVNQLVRGEERVEGNGGNESFGRDALCS